MARAALRIEVTTKDKKQLRRLLRGGIQQVRVVLRAVAMLQLAKGVSAPKIAGMVPLTAQADGTAGGRRIRQTATGAARGPGNHPHPAAQPRPQAVAGKKCGAWPN